MSALLTLTPEKRIPYRVAITDLYEHDLANIIVALQVLIQELHNGTQRIQCEELVHTLKGQLAARLKKLKKA